jgi:hypothetical protein
MKNAKRHMSDDELDQLFRDAHAAEGTEPLFVPEFWSEMEAMLPPSQKKRILLPWISIAATITIGLFLMYYPSNPSIITSFSHQGQPLSETRESEKLENKTNQELLSGTDTPAQNKTLISPEMEQSHQVNVQKSRLIPRLKKETKPFFEEELAKVDHPILNKESSPIDSAPLNEQGTHSEDLSFTKLEVIGLEGNTDEIRVPQRTLNNDLPPSMNKWYLELGPTLGQSPYISTNKKRNLVGGAVLGAGYIVKMDQTFISLGLQARIEGFGGLNYQETNFSPGIVRNVSVKQLYSIDLPIRFGYQLGRSEIAFGIVPGIQLFMHGKEQIIENQVVTRTQNFTGKVQHSSTMSMEFGIQYYYRFSPNYSIGAKFNADILRPFHTDYYLGKVIGFPLNGQIVLRRTFGK